MATDIIRGRQTVVVLTNDSGGGVDEGDVVIVDNGTANSFVTTAVEGQSAEMVGVALESIANGSEGRVCVCGYVQKVNLDGAAALGDWIKTDGVATQATPQAAPGEGCFGQVLEANATPPAIIFPHPLQATGGAPVGAEYFVFSADATLTNEAVRDDFYGRNLVKNSPGEIFAAGVDGNEPQWWDEGDANATLTDEDAAGEACSDLTERVFKLVTIANDKYGYGTATFADEELLDAGVTEVSFSCWVWCAAGATASIGIYGTNLGLQESAQHTGGSGWELLTVEGITLNAADASIQYRLICDTGTAFFTMPMLNVGPHAWPWVERGEKFVPLGYITQLDLNTTGDVAWSDTDCTANTDPLATAVQGISIISEPDGTVQSYMAIGHHDDIIGADQRVIRNDEQIVNRWFFMPLPKTICNESQVIRYQVEEIDGDNDVRAQLKLTGYWRWK